MLPQLLAILTIVITVFTRTWDIAKLPNGLHWDEMDTGYQAYSLLKTGRDYFGTPLPVHLHAFADYRTPLYMYATVPAVAALGLTPLSVRLFGIVSGLLGIFFSYLLAREFLGRRRAWIMPLILAFSPWQFQFSRFAVESNSMITFFLLGLVGFFKKRYWLATIGFALSIWSYSTAQFFVPIIVLALVIIYKNFRQVFIPFAVLGLLISPLLLDSFFGKGGTRFHDVAIYTDPQLASVVNIKRQEALLSRLPVAQIGLQPSLLDRLVINKPVLVINKFVSNYLSAFSIDFLFLKGDPNPRHSPGPEAIGELHLIEVIPLILGLILLTSLPIPHKRFLIFWLLLAPVPAALTRDGASHATRMFFLLPALLLLITLGLRNLPQKFLGLYLIAYAVSCVFIYHYYFTTYRWESTKPFQWGFTQIVKDALAASPNYSRVIIDTRDDSALMAYLFTTKFDPVQFQKMLPLPEVTLAEGVSGNQFGNVLLLSPGIRNWTDLLSLPQLRNGTLVIADAQEPLIDKSPHLKTVYYPSHIEAFYYITR